MRSRFGIFFGTLALLQILGGHWALLAIVGTAMTNDEATRQQIAKNLG
jgi:hypothetical protein